MTIIYTFTYNGNIASYPKSIPSYHVLGCVDNIQGKFVTLADYNQLQDNTQHNIELIRLQGDTIKAQVEEITKLKDTLALSVINSHNLIDSTYQVMDNEIKLLRGLLEQWVSAYNTPSDYQPASLEEMDANMKRLYKLVDDTNEALK